MLSALTRPAVTFTHRWKGIPSTTSTTLDGPLTNPLPPPAGLVAGVDTHKNTHHVAILDLVGRPVADRGFRADGRAYAQVIDCLQCHDDIARVGVEGTGSYGAGLAGALNAAGLTVVEVARQDWQARRRRGKSDPLDAHQAAIAVLVGTDTAIPKSGDGAVASMRILLAERRSAAKARAQVMKQIHALLITAPELVRQAFRHLSGRRLVNTLSSFAPLVRPVADSRTSLLWPVGGVDVTWSRAVSGP